MCLTITGRLISKAIPGLCTWFINKTSCCFCSATVVNIPFVAFGSGLVLLISVRSADSTASFFICVRIRFEPCNNHYLAAFVLPRPAICFCGKTLYLHNGINPPNNKCHSKRKSSTKRKFYRGHHSFHREKGVL